VLTKELIIQLGDLNGCIPDSPAQIASSVSVLKHESNLHDLDLDDETRSIGKEEDKDESSCEEYMEMTLKPRANFILSHHSQIINSMNT
jgi:hypothetical protein